MTSSLPNKPNLNLLKKQAKKLLKQFRDGNLGAIESVNSNHPKPETFTGLRDAQLVIARSYGFAGWSELSEAVELAQYSDKNLADKATLLIQLGCVQYSGNDTLRNYQRARNLLAACPEIAEFDFYTALVSNNTRAVLDYLNSDSTLAVSVGGPLDWPPLLYVIYSRIGETDDSQDSVFIVNQLLERGADPDSHVILNDTYRFTALTGAMGEGEQGVNQPAHPYANEIADLLLDAGASPNEGQGLYNTMFTNSADKWLALLLSKGLNAEQPLNWDADGQDVPVTTLDYQLSSAVDSNRLARATLLLNAGANPNAFNTYNGRAIHTNALLAGHTAIARLLKERGAVAEKLDFKDQFRLACINENDDAIATLLESHSEIMHDATILHAAAEYASFDVVKMLIARGFDINGLSTLGRTLLHHYALSNDAERIHELLCLGARADIRDSSYDSIAAGFAAHSASYDAMRVLLNSSNSLLDVICCAYLERAKAIVQGNPASLHQRTELGNTVLHIIGYWLHDEPEYDTYESLIEWLVSAGADVTAVNNKNQTPEQFNLANGHETVAEILADHARR